jgi:hypothetical protein
MLPNFLIIGVPRGGTTWIQSNIRVHPEIFMPAKKEIHFFNREYQKGMRYYEKYFSKVADEKAIGEATPDYLHKKDVAERIHKNLGEDIKFIISLRNPVDRLYSRFWNAKTRFKANKDLSFEEKIKLKPQFIEEGFYIDHIQRYLNYYKKEQFLFLLYDDMKKDSDGFLKDIYSFLEVDPDYVSPLQGAVINSAKTRPSSGKNPVMYYTSKVVKKLGLASVAYHLETSNKIEYPSMNPDTKEWLVNEVYSEKNKRLQALIKKDISHWNTLT